MQFIQASCYNEMPNRQIDLIVLHCMQAEDKPTLAEDIAAWFARMPRNPNTGASTHYCSDMNSIVQCVLDKDIAWAAPGANGNGLHFELPGFAEYKANNWSAQDLIDCFQLTAKVIRDKCNVYNIPMQYVDAAALQRGVRGITTHLQVTRAFKQGDHWDPGYDFPIDAFVSMVNQQQLSPEEFQQMIGNQAVAFIDSKKNGGNTGYGIAVADGSVYSFGDFDFHGSMGNRSLAAPIVDAQATDGGYRLLGADGGVFDFGAAQHCLTNDGKEPRDLFN